jgi:hypothetical protein
LATIAGIGLNLRSSFFLKALCSAGVGRKNASVLLKTVAQSSRMRVAAASRRQQKHPAGRPVNSQAGRLRYVAFGSSR